MCRCQSSGKKIGTQQYRRPPNDNNNSRHFATGKRFFPRAESLALAWSPRPPQSRPPPFIPKTTTIYDLGPSSDQLSSQCRFDRPSSNRPITTPLPCLGIPSHPPHLPVTGSRRAGGRNTFPTVYTVTRLARSSSSPVGVYRGIAPGHPYPTHRLAACPCLASSRLATATSSSIDFVVSTIEPLPFCSFP